MVFNKRSRYTAIFVIIICLISYNLSTGADVLRISIPEQVIVNKPRIKLGNIARIEGVEDERLKAVKDIDLGKSPIPGYSRKYNREFIRLLLQQEGYPPAAIKLDIPLRFTVKTASRTITAEKILNFVERYIRSNLENDGDKLKIKYVYYPEEIIVPDTDYKLEIAVDKKINLKGRMTLPVVILIDDQEWKQVYIGLDISLKRDVYIALRDIKRGEKINKSDFKLVTRELQGLRGKPVVNLDSSLVRNSVTTEPINKGEILTANSLEKPVVISWGDRIQVEVIIGNVTISTKVKARQAGRVGDYIIVENIRTGYKFSARVVNPYLVRVVRK